MDVWVRVDEPRGRRAPASDARAAAGAVTGPGDRTSHRAPRGAAQRHPGEAAAIPDEVAAEIRRAADTATSHHKEALVERMTDATVAYDRHRYSDALRLGQQLVREVPTVAAVRRLTGFAAYRMERWRLAVRHLEAYGEQTGEVDAVPALMDCLRALGRPRRVTDLWADLRRRSPDADVLAEARIVAASSLADRGRLAEAIDLLTAAGAARALRNPSDRHVRQWYVLADIYERVGDVPRARQLFERVEHADPGAYDVEERLESLGRAQGTFRRRPRRQ